MFTLSDIGIDVANFVASLTPSPGISDVDDPAYAPLHAPVGIAVTGVAAASAPGRSRRPASARAGAWHQAHVNTMLFG